MEESQAVRLLRAGNVFADHLVDDRGQLRIFDSSTSGDLCQEVLLSAIRRDVQLSAGQLRRGIRRRFIDAMRRSRRQASISSRELEDRASWDVFWVSRDADRLTDQVVRALRDDDAAMQVLQALLHGQFRSQEIADSTDQSLGVVKNARRRVRRCVLRVLSESKSTAAE